MFCRYAINVRVWFQIYYKYWWISIWIDIFLCVHYKYISNYLMAIIFKYCFFEVFKFNIHTYIIKYLKKIKIKRFLTSTYVWRYLWVKQKWDFGIENRHVTSQITIFIISNSQLYVCIYIKKKKHISNIWSFWNIFRF